MSFIEEFKDAMRAAGIEPMGEIIADGKRHRIDLAGDRKHARNGWYILYSDYPQSGSFGSWRLGLKEKWTTRSRKQLSAEEREAQRKMIEEQRQAREKAERDAKAKAAAKAQSLWARAPLAGDHPYLERKGIKPLGGVRIYRGALVVPARSPKGELLSLQFIAADGQKRFLTDGHIEGCYCTIGKPDKTILICEGYATGASLHLATGHAVVVAFNAGNLLSVSKSIRAKFPEDRIIICADNDAWTKLPDGRENPGKIYGEAAAKAIRGYFCLPQFMNSEPGRTDFNDLAGCEGLTRVFAQVERCYQLVEPQDEEQPPHLSYEQQLGDQTNNTPPPPEEPDHDQDNAAEPEEEYPFLALGYSKGPVYHFLSAGTQQVTDLTPSQLSKSNLMHLAPLSYWKKNFQFDGAKNPNWDQAADQLMYLCHQMGNYNPDRIRGRGAWWDDGKVALHLGDRVLLAERQFTPRKVPSRFIYESGPALAADTQNWLSNKEANRFMQLMEMLAWEKPIAARLAAGWCVCAHIGGALRWRPHIWVVGRKGSGKSFIMSEVIRKVLGDNCIFVVSESSEAGIRQTLGHDSLPVLFDEAEGEDQRSNDRLQRVLALVRQSSSETGAKIMKGTTSGKSMSFSVRSCFAFSSINANLVQQSDRSRVSVLEVAQEHRKADFQDILKAHAELFENGYSERFFARALKLAPVIRANADMFARVVAVELGEQRAGDQLGTLLAGAYALYSHSIISFEAASKWVKEQDWTETKDEVSGQSDERMLWTYLMQSRITIDLRNHKTELPIAEVIELAVGDTFIENKNVGVDDARLALMRSGFRLMDDRKHVAVANRHPVISRILRESPWPANWSRILRRLPGAKPSVGNIYFGAAGTEMRATILPVFK